MLFLCSTSPQYPLLTSLHSSSSISQGLATQDAHVLSTRTHYRMIGSNLQSFIPPLAGAKPQILVRWAEDFGHSFLEYVLKPRSTPQCLAKIAVGRIWSEWWAGCLWTTFVPSWMFHGPEHPAETKQPVGKHEPHGLPELSMLILL